jgi:hypothetical protein
MVNLAHKQRRLNSQLGEPRLSREVTLPLLAQRRGGHNGRLREAVWATVAITSSLFPIAQNLPCLFSLAGKMISAARRLGVWNYLLSCTTLP